MLLVELHQTFRLLQVFGFHPSQISYQIRSRVNNNHFLKPWLTDLFLIALSIVYMLLNGSMLCYNVYAMYYYYFYFGMWDAETIMIVISGMKPLQCLINIGNFVSKRSKHAQLLCKLAALDLLYREEFGIVVNGRRANNKTLVVAMVVTVCCFGLRLFQYLLRGEHPGSSWYSDVSFILIIFLGLWQVLPLYYFHIISSVLLFWLEGLERVLKRQKRNLTQASISRHNIEFLVDTYFQLTDTIKAVDRVFNAFILLSAARCVFSVCLTLYFFVEAETILNLPPDLDNNIRYSIYTNIGWSTLEIVLAVIYILVFSIDGIKINERSRTIISPLLNYPVRTDKDRFQIYLLSQKAAWQDAWGITAWRTFPMKRNFGFTLISGIITYFFLLKKLKQDTAVPCFLDNKTPGFEINQTSS